MPIAVYNGQHRALSILQMAPFFRSDSSFPNAAYNSLLYCALQVCLFPLPFPRYVNGKFWEENFDGKRKEGVWFQDTESLKEASLNGLLIYAFVCQLPTNWHLALHLTAEYTLPEWHVRGASSLKLLEIIKTKTGWVEEKGPVFQERVPFNPFLCNRTIFHNSAKRFRVRTCDLTWAGIGFYRLILQAEMEIKKPIGIMMIMQTLDIVEYTAGHTELQEEITHKELLTHT